MNNVVKASVAAATPPCNAFPVADELLNFRSGHSFGRTTKPVHLLRRNGEARKLLEYLLPRGRVWQGNDDMSIQPAGSFYRGVKVLGMICGPHDDHPTPALKAIQFLKKAVDSLSFIVVVVSPGSPVAERIDFIDEQ